MAYASKIATWFKGGLQPNNREQLADVFIDIDNALVAQNGAVVESTGGATATALPVTGTSLLITTGAQSFTLAAAPVGTVKTLIFKTDGGDATITPVVFKNGTTITFDTAGDSVTLKYVDGGWQLISNVGATIA